LCEQIAGGLRKVFAQLQSQRLGHQQAISQLPGRAQDARGIALLKGLGMKRLGITPGLLDTIAGPALRLSLQGPASTCGGDVLARQMGVARLGGVQSGFG
jgi:hypothetical protein